MKIPIPPALRRLGLVAAAGVALALGLTSPAAADYPVKDKDGATVNICAKTISSNQAPCQAVHIFDGSVYRPMLGDSSGRPTVNINGTVPVSASALPLPTSAATDAAITETTGTKAPGTAATKSQLAGCVYTSAGVTLTNGQQAALQCDSSGNVKTTGGGGGGGAATIADGADVTQGAIADSTWSGSGSGTQIAIDKYVGTKVEAVRALLAGTVAVSAASLPLPTGAATSAKQPALGTAGTPSSDVITVQGADSMKPLATVGSTFACSFTLTRPSNTTNYGTNVALANATSGASTAGACSNASRVSGGVGQIVKLTVTGSVDATTDLSAELIGYAGTAPTAINDNAAYTPSDSDANKEVCRIPFSLTSGDVNNSHFHGDALLCTYATNGSTTITWMVKVVNQSPVYTPTSAEAYQFSLVGEYRN